MTRPVVVLVAVLAVVLGGCSGQDARGLLDGASEALAEAGTSRFELEVATAGAPDERLTALGAQDLGTGALSMDLHLADGAVATQTLLLGTDVFVRSDVFALFTGDPTLWVRIDLAAAASDEGIDLAALGAETGPAALLGQLDGASGQVEELDREEVRGVATRRLRVTIVTEQAIAQAAPAVRDQLRTYARASGLPATYPMDVWIDDRGLVRRLRTVLDVPRTPGQEEGDAGDRQDAVTQQTTLELFDFGVSVDLRPPRPEQTVDLRDLIAELDAGG